MRMAKKAYKEWLVSSVYNFLLMSDGTRILIISVYVNGL
jgi:hypothetical protein